MGTCQVAHIKHQGVDLIIIPMDSSYHNKSNREQNEIRDALQVCASAAGLAGRVVPVWDAGFGRMGFLAPSAWSGFFQSIDLTFVASNINRRLTCG
jgi:hypothetical protein